MSIKNQLQAINDDYYFQISKLTDYIRKEHIIPLCNKYQLNFIAGNGIFVFIDRKTKKTIYRDDLDLDCQRDKDIYNLCHDYLYPVTLDNISIGCQCNDYNL